MFMPCSDDVLVPESAILGFCSALNTPVINVEDLSVGPARAAILLATEENGDLLLVVRVARIATGEGKTFKFQGDPNEFGDPTSALDAALGFSEGMGFLLEEIPVSDGLGAGSQRAIKIWESLFALPEQSARGADAVKTRGAASGTALAVPAELELTDAVVEGEVASAQLIAGQISEDVNHATASDVEMQAVFNQVVEAAFKAPNQPDAAIGATTGSLTQSFVDDTGERTEFAAPNAQEAVMGARLLTKFRTGPVNETRLPPGAERQVQIALASETVGAGARERADYLTRLLSSF